MGILSKKAIIELVDNPNFQKWFGKSAVVDAEGLPLNVVHRVQSAPHDGPLPFTEFDPAMSRDGSGRTWFGVSDGGYARDGKEIEGFLSPENIFDIRNPDHHSIYRQWQGEEQIPKRVQNGWTEEQARAFGKKVNPGNTWSLLDPEFVSWLKEKHPKFDATYESEGGYPGWAIFDPRKFKSVGNAGTFDPLDPNFLKSAGLMTAGAGAAAYGMSPDDAEAAKLPRALNTIKSIIGDEAFEYYKGLPPVGESIAKEDLKALLDNLEGASDGYVGIRSIDPTMETPKLGGKVKPSKVWRIGESGEYEPTRLNAAGPSALDISEQPFEKRYGDRHYLDLADRYYGPKYVLGSEYSLPLEDWNVDTGEIVMDSPRVLAGFDKVDRDTWKRIVGLGLTGAGAYGLMSPDDAEASVSTNLEKALVRDAEGAVKPKGWAKDAGSNTPNVAQAVTPSDPFTQSPSKLAATAALISALKAKDAPLEDTYQPADLLTAFATGGGGVLPRLIQAGLDPVLSAGLEYIPRLADAINPRNIITGLMR